MILIQINNTQYYYHHVDDDNDGGQATRSHVMCDFHILCSLSILTTEIGLANNHKIYCS